MAVVEIDLAMAICNEKDLVVKTPQNAVNLSFVSYLLVNFPHFGVIKTNLLLVV